MNVLHKAQPAGVLSCLVFRLRCGAAFFEFQLEFDEGVKLLGVCECGGAQSHQLLLSRIYLLMWETGPRAPNLCHRNGSCNCRATWKAREKNRTRWTHNCAFVYVRAPKQDAETVQLH